MTRASIWGLDGFRLQLTCLLWMLINKQQQREEEEEEEGGVRRTIEFNQIKQKDLSSGAKT